MVRPKERYRHGARRKSEQLDPVFVLEQRRAAAVSSTGTGLYRVISGELGQLFAVDVFGSSVPAMPQPSTADPGLIAAMTAYITTSPQVTVTSSSYVAPVTYQSQVLFAFQYHDLLYLTINRWAVVEHIGSLTYEVQGSFGQGVIAVGTLGPTSAFVEVGDVITLAINLQTQDVTAVSAALLQGTIAVTGYVYGGSLVGYYFTRTDTRTQETPYLKIYETIPQEHPLQAFGANLWSGSSPGPSGFKTGQVYNFQINNLLNLCLGYGDETGVQRIIKRSNVLEWADISYAGLTQARRLGEAWIDSFAGYGSSSLEDRDQLLLTDSLSPSDQTAFLAVVEPAPGSIPPSSVVAGITTDGRYFLESPSMLADDELSINQGWRTFLRYRIVV